MRSKHIINFIIILSIFVTISDNIAAKGSTSTRSSYDLTKELRLLQKLEGELLDHRMSVKKNITDSNRILFRGPNGDVIIMSRYKVNNIIDRIILISELTGLDNRIIRALPTEYSKILKFARFMGVKISKHAHNIIWEKINSTQSGLHKLERQRIREINDLLEYVRSRVKRILIERKRLRIIEKQPVYRKHPVFRIKGLWKHSKKIKVRFRDEFNGYYVNVSNLKDYGFKSGDLGFRVKKIGPKTYNLDVKFCYRLPNRAKKPCFWKKNKRFTIIDNNTMKDSWGAIWTRVRY